MVHKTPMASLILALALPLAAIARAPQLGDAGAVRSSPPAASNQTPAHHKVRCCSGRMQAQPRPPH